jgi:hypothetical protein
MLRLVPAMLAPQVDSCDAGRHCGAPTVDAMRAKSPQRGVGATTGRVGAGEGARAVALFDAMWNHSSIATHGWWLGSATRSHEVKEF